MMYVGFLSIGARGGRSGVLSVEATNYIVTLSGDDRPGILDDVAGVIQRNSGRIVELRSVEAGGQFAMLITVRIGSDAVEALSHQLNELTQTRGLRTVVSEAVECQAARVHQFRLIARGDDQLGVLKKLSHLLRVLSINIEDIVTHNEIDGQVTMTLTLGVPRECPVSKLKEFLAQLLGANNMMWELSAV